MSVFNGPAFCLWLGQKSRHNTKNKPQQVFSLGLLSCAFLAVFVCMQKHFR